MFRKISLYIFIIGVLGGLMENLHFLSHFWSNLGAVSVLRTLVTESQIEQIGNAERLFQKALFYDPHNYHAIWWRGLTLALEGRDEESISVWRLGKDIDLRLMALAKHAREQQRYETTRHWLELAVRVSPDSRAVWNYLADFYQYLIFSRDESLVEEYVAYVKWNQGNWIINGDFDQGYLSWKKYNPSGDAASFLVDVSSEGNTLSIQGKTLAFHGGWYQRLSLQTGSVYRLSADIKIDGDSTLNTEILSWQHFVKGQKTEHPGQSWSGKLDWTHFEVDFMVPLSDEGIVLYPAMLHGAGQVWVDNVTVVELPH